MRINYNVSAMLANNTLSNSNDALSKSIQRLSSGLKINKAKDNPSGLAMAKRMDGQIAGTGVAKQNGSDGIAVLETADGALSEVHNMLQRMTELVTKAASDSNTEYDRKILQDEIDELKKEVTRISQDTQYNGQYLLDGSIDIKAFCTTGDGSMPPKTRVSTVNSEVSLGEYTIDQISWTANQTTGEMEVTLTGPGGGFPGVNFDDYSISMVDNAITIEHSNGMRMVLEVNKNLAFNANGYPISGSITEKTTITVTGVGAMRLQVGANEGQVIPVEIPATSLTNMGIEHLSVETHEQAQDAIDRMKNAIQFVSSVRGKIGAYQNRLEATTDNLGVLEENLTSAYTRIMDLDMAEEMTQYTTHNIIVQAGTSVLAQANERPSQVLQLLQ